MHTRIRQTRAQAYPELKTQICPQLGMKDDAESVSAFPSTTNFCFHVRPAREVDLDHQRKFCLPGNYKQCELLITKGGGSKKNKKILAHRSKRVTPATRKMLAGILGGSIVVVIVSWLALSWSGLNLPIPVGVSSEVITPIAIEITSAPSRNTDFPIPSSTAIPATPTMLVKHTLDTPIGSQIQLVVHQIKDGESLPILANHFNTTESAIIKINYTLHLPLWTDTVIVIPFNQTDISTMPFFEAYQVPGDTSLETLAKKFSVEVDALKYYNLVDSEYTFTVGEWVLIPHANAATPND